MKLADLGRRLEQEPPIPPTPVGDLRRRSSRRRLRRGGMAAAAVAAGIAAIVVGVSSTSTGRAAKVQLLSPTPAVSVPGPAPTAKVPPAPKHPGALVHLPPVTVPNLVGRSYWTEIDLNVVDRYQYSSTVPAGIVISQGTPPGTVEAFDSDLTLVVSKGPASIPGAGTCTASDLRISRGGLVSEETGQHTTDWSLTNVSGSACVLDGYPSVTLYDRAGRVLPFTYSHSGDQMTTSAPPSPVYLPPKSAAWVRINKYRCDIRAQDTSLTARLALPSGGGTLQVGLTSNEEYCAESASLVVAVSPFEPVEVLLFAAR